MPYITEASEGLIKRYWPKVKKDKKGCWWWEAARNPAGYGVIGIGGRHKGNVRATHVAWLLGTGKPVPKGKFVCHHCDNPLCVNPRHLFIGDAWENTRDMIAKGRNSAPPVHIGVDNPQSKLTIGDVRRIRRLASGKITHKEIATLIGVNRTTITKVLSGQTWGHIQ